MKTNQIKALEIKGLMDMVNQLDSKAMFYKTTEDAYLVIDHKDEVISIDKSYYDNHGELYATKTKVNLAVEIDEDTDKEILYTIITDKYKLNEELEVVSVEEVSSVDYKRRKTAMNKIIEMITDKSVNFTGEYISNC